MSAAAAIADDRAPRGDPHKLGSRGDGEGERPGGIAPRRIVTSFGFWIFLLSDIVMFSAFFAAYAVLSDATAGGPRAAELFDLRNAAVLTALLLTSSFTCGLAGIAGLRGDAPRTQAALLVTALLGLAFLVLELREFATMIADGAGPQRSAFLSAFFALVGCHGVHVAIGLVWAVTMMAQIQGKGLREDILRRLLCFGLYWHALDIIWVGVLTVVYLVGARG